MKTEDAYNILKDYLGEQNHIAILNQSYSPDTFGNFVIGFTEYDVKQSIICDRGEIYLCHGLNGETNCTFIVPCIYEMEKSDLIAALRKAN